METVPTTLSVIFCLSFTVLWLSAASAIWNYSIYCSTCWKGVFVMFCFRIVHIVSVKSSGVKVLTQTDWCLQCYSYCNCLLCWIIPVNMLDPICIHPDWLRSISQKWVWWFLTTGFLLDQIHLAKTRHIQPEPNQIWAGFAQCDLGHLSKNAAESESGKHWWQASSVLPELGPLILAHQLASEPDVFGHRLTRSSRSDLGWFCTIWSRSSLKEQNQIGCENLDPVYNAAWFWLQAGLNGHNGPWPKHFQTGSSMFAGYCR